MGGYFRATSACAPSCHMIASFIILKIMHLTCPSGIHESYHTGADPGFQVRGAHLKKLRRAEGGAKILEVFRVKNHDFTPTNHIFSNFRGGCAPPPPTPLDPPLSYTHNFGYFKLYFGMLAKLIDINICSKFHFSTTFRTCWFLGMRLITIHRVRL